MSSNLREVEIQISMGNLQDQIAALLYATGHVNDDEDIEHIVFGNLKNVKRDGLVPLTIKVRSPERMELTEF